MVRTRLRKTVEPLKTFGGFKMSGVGRDRGNRGIEAYAEIQALSWMA